MRQYYVYILANHSRRLYIGVTSDLLGRVHKHKEGAVPGFTKSCRITNLVYFETTANITSAIAREKQLKRWTRARKYRLIEKHNAGWRDLSVDWYPPIVIPHERSERQALLSPRRSQPSRGTRSRHALAALARAG